MKRTAGNWPDGQAAFVTGAASGIGLGIARALVSQGAKVALTDIDADRLAAAARELRDAGGTVVDLVLDVTSPEEWSTAADRAEEALGPISILINNAGAGSSGEIIDTPLHVWRWVYKLNIESQFIGVSTFLPRFRKRGGRCHVLNTASAAGLVPMTRTAAYASAKAASISFTSVLRSELDGTDIGVSILCAGTVATRIATTSHSGEATMLERDVDKDAMDAMGAIIARGASPDRVGEQVVEAMEQGQFFIVTHSDWGPLVKSVHDEIQNAYSEFDDRHGHDEVARTLARHGWSRVDAIAE